MNQPMRHFAFGLSTGVTVFAVVVPPIHLLVALAALIGVELGRWDNPVGVFIFAMTTLAVGVPWGLWIALTDARRGDMFDRDEDFIAYQIAALGVFVTLTILTCTGLQPVYEQFQWLFTPALFVCAVTLIWWRWRRVWSFPMRGGVRSLLDRALPVQRDS